MFILLILVYITQKSSNFFIASALISSPYVDVGLHRLVIIISQNAYEKMVFLKLIKSKSKCTHF
jgi:hypothetical protein